MTYAVRSLGITTLGVVGETLKGPAFQPIDISNWREFQDIFGGTSTEKYKGSQYPKYELPYIAKSYLTESEQLKVVRVLGLSGYNAGPAWIITAAKCGTDSQGDQAVVVLRSRGGYDTYKYVGEGDCICDRTQYDTLRFAVGDQGSTIAGSTCSKKEFLNSVSLSKYTSITDSGDECTGYNYSGVENGFGVSTSDHGHFTINVTTSDNEHYSYPVSLNPFDKDYILNVLGQTPFDADAPNYVKPPIYVESLYDVALAQGIEDGSIGKINTAVSFYSVAYLADYCHHTPVQSVMYHDVNAVASDGLARRHNGYRYLASTGVSEGCDDSKNYNSIIMMASDSSSSDDECGVVDFDSYYSLWDYYNLQKRLEGCKWVNSTQCTELITNKGNAEAAKTEAERTKTSKESELSNKKSELATEKAKSPKTPEILARIAELEAEIAVLNDEISKLTTDISGLTVDINTWDSMLKTIPAKVSLTKGQIYTVKQIKAGNWNHNPYEMTYTSISYEALPEKYSDNEYYYSINYTLGVPTPIDNDSKINQVGSLKDAGLGKGNDIELPEGATVVYNQEDGLYYRWSTGHTDVWPITVDLNNYKSAYRYASTPWIVSNLKGDKNHAELNKLFRFHTISDGDAANYQVKISIENIRTDEGVFDVVVRDINDTDESVKPIEKFQRCSMIPRKQQLYRL